MRYVIVLVLTSLMACAPPEAPFEPMKDVDPNIGSVHGRWFFYTPAAVPFGMAKLAPHTNAYGSPGSWLPAGYDDRHTSIEGFGHFHEFQIGGVVVMPTTGPIQNTPGTLENPDEGYRSRFDKNEEQAEPGYYAVRLKDYDIQAELTATQRVGFHRYTFPESETANLLFDIGHRQGESSDVIEASATLIGEREVEGYVITNPEYVKFCDPGNRVKMYFVARLSRAPQAVGTFDDEGIYPDERTTTGVGNGLYLTYATTHQDVIEMQVGLSYTSIDNARLNLTTESEGHTFDTVRQSAHQSWNDMLGRIKVEGGQQHDRTKFYTGLYHALLGRGLASDGNGAYPRNDGGIGQIPLDDEGNPAYHHYNTDGIWGGFWNLGQLWALAYPDYLSEYVQANIDFYKETGWLHDGVAAGTYTNGVQTNYQGLLIAATYNAGIRDFDVATGYEAARKNELVSSNRDFGSGKYDLGYFVRMGYIPSMDTTISNGWVFNFGASHSLEFSFSSYAVAELANALGHDEDEQLLRKQAGYYRNLFDPETKYIRPKEFDGTFIKDFDPMEPWVGFQEGNGFQYTWYVPHDPAGLMGLVGKDLFNERLQMMFTEAQKSTFGGGEEIDSFSGLEKLYNHGNQPSLHNAWLFNYSGKPWLTQKWTRAIMHEFYGTTGLHGYGFGQDEDQGQLGAWYVMAALGLFDVQGHASSEPTFQFGSPLFDKVTIKLDETYYTGKELVIEAENQAPQNSYVTSLTWNGESLDTAWIPRSTLMNGGTLRFTMSATPDTTWGVGTPPPSMISQN